MKRVLIVDGQPLFREALSLHLEAIYPESAVFEANSLNEAQGVLETYSHFDLIVLDIPAIGVDGVEWLHAIRAKAMGSKIVVMSCLDDPAMVKTLIAQGASGYVAKSAGAGDVRNALHLVLAGEIYISPALLVGGAVYQPHHIANVIEVVERPVLPLTPRQMDVFHLMAQGLPNKSIATQLNCSDGTVKLHVSAILKALHARNRTEAVQVGVDKLIPKVA